jgi:hypothetical protein
MASSPAARSCRRRNLANGHGKGNGGHWQVAGLLPRRAEVVGGREVVQRDDGVDSGGEQRTARSGLGLGGTVLGVQWCVRELAQRGVRRAYWSNAGNTGAWGASSMAASCLCSHGGFG